MESDSRPELVFKDTSKDDTELKKVGEIQNEDIVDRIHISDESDTNASSIYVKTNEQNVLQNSHAMPFEKPDRDIPHILEPNFIVSRKRKEYCKYNNRIDEDWMRYVFDKKVKTEPVEIPLDIVSHEQFGRPRHGSYGCHRFHKFKKSRSKISLQMKMDIIRYAELNPRMRQVEIANVYGIDRTAVTKILKRKLELKEFYHDGQSAGLNMNLPIYKQKHCKFRQMETLLNNWYNETMNENSAIEISDQLVKERAMEIAQMLRISGFQASDVWLKKFYDRFHMFQVTTQKFANKGIADMFDGNLENNDDGWLPPTAAEEKILKAKRERTDKISEIMGDKLLRGWRMLADSCDSCSTVMLQDRSGVKICVACDELDSDSQKDDPAVDARAAASQMREDISGVEENGDTFVSGLQLPRPQITRCSNAEHEGLVPLGDSGTTPSDDVVVNIGDTLDVLVEKVKWATDALRASNNITSDIQLCNLIKSAADAIVSTKAINSKKIDSTHC